MNYSNGIMYNIVTAFPLLLWLGLIGYGISENSDNSRPFEQSQALALRGVCAIEIMIGHIGLATGSAVLYANRKAGILFVGIFFMLSGYGVAYSAENKKDYHKRFLLNRAIKILIPAYIAKIVVIIFEYFALLYLGMPISIQVRDFLLGFSWYVWEQLFFYLLYWLAYKLTPGYIEIFVVIGSLILIIAAFIGKIDNPWYGSSLCFALGLYYYKFCKGHPTIRFSKRYYFLLAAVGLIWVMSLMTFFGLGNESVVGNPIARNIASASFCIMVVMVLYKLKIGNAVSKFLGRCSYEIFLIHPSILSLLKVLSIESAVLIEILTLILTIALAYAAHCIVVKIYSISAIRNNMR